jgi:hypothetical protein
VKTLKACLNWKVLASLGALGVAIYLIAPSLVAAALPILLLAACPLSMALMMWSMHRSEGQQATRDTEVGLTREEHLVRLHAQQSQLADRIGELEREEARPAENGRER